MDWIRRSLMENFGAPFHWLASGDQSFTLNEVPDLSGKVGLVTGGSEGEKMDEALKKIEEELGVKARQAVDWRQCDLSDWEQTSKVATDICKNTDRMDIFINNAARGIMTRQLAPTNGIDLHMAGNHFGHVVLVSHLLPLLKRTAEKGNKVRIVNVVSNLHAAGSFVAEFASVDELNMDYGPTIQYGRSKLAELLHAKWLAQHVTPQHPNILVNAAYPGIVDTAQTNDHIHEAHPVIGYGMSVGLKPFRKNIWDGCVSSMYAATVCEDSGLYITSPKIVEDGDPRANDMELAERLMNLTKKVVDERTKARGKGCPLQLT
ncbi:hypothetical protein LTR27_012162 [Elasticomyces elasticus]|nr:hypothetical protein LTR27_012162 [Elasticomyces elasticus]